MPVEQYYNQDIGKISLINQTPHQCHNVAYNHLKHLIIYHLTYIHVYIIEFNIDPPIASDLHLNVSSNMEHFSSVDSALK